MTDNTKAELPVVAWMDKDWQGKHISTSAEHLDSAPDVVKKSWRNANPLVLLSDAQSALAVQAEEMALAVKRAYLEGFSDGSFNESESAKPFHYENAAWSRSDACAALGGQS